MANIPISQLPALPNANGTTLIPVVANGITQQISCSNLSSFFQPVINFVDGVVPTAVGSSTTVFTLPSTPNPSASLILVRDGLVQKAGGIDYTLVGNTITYTIAISAGDTHEAYYRY